MIVILLLLIIVFSALMDAERYINAWAVKKGYKKLAYWSDSKSWENKYQLMDWLIKKGVPSWLAKFLAKDVLVIFTDLWHFCKACMMLCIYAITAPYFNYPLWVVVPTLFVIGGAIFNFIYYKLQKI